MSDISIFVQLKSANRKLQQILIGDKSMWIFSTREIASLIYILIFILYALTRKKVKDSAVNVIKVACTPKLLIPFIVMLLYASFIVIILTKLSFWNWIYLKDIIIWVLFAGVPVCFNAVSNTIKEHYFRNMITDNIKFAALVEFFTGTFTFSLIIELIILPVLTFFILLQAVSEYKEENKSAHKVFNWIVAILGFLILGFTIETAISSYKSIEGTQIIVSFCLPLIFSFLYLPIAHGFAVYAKYEMLFIRMSFKEPKDKKVRWNHRRKVISTCKFSYNKICMFSSEYVKNMYVTMKDNEFDAIIHNFKVANSK